MKYLIVLTLFIQGLSGFPFDKFSRPTPTEKRILVTGCSRSGTTFMSLALSASGLDVRHENIGRDGCVSWTMAVNDTVSPWGPPFQEGIYKHIFHQVRDPLKTIASVMATELPRSWEFIQKHIPQINNYDSLLVKAVKYWIYWNRFAEAKSEMTYRIEDIAEVYGEIGNRIGYRLDPRILSRVSTTTNHRADYQHVPTWEELEAVLPTDLFIELRDQAIRYGY
jgi:hypothetical protein